MLRLAENLQGQLVTAIEALKIGPRGTPAASIADNNDWHNRPEPVSEGPMGLGASMASSIRIPLTKESLDLMDTPVPSGVGLAAEFAYHGLAPSFLKKMHQAQQLLGSIYSEIKKYASCILSKVSQSMEGRKRIAQQFEMAYVPLKLL